jgi:hypothetical protein
MKKGRFGALFSFRASLHGFSALLLCESAFATVIAI